MTTFALFVVLCSTSPSSSMDKHSTISARGHLVKFQLPPVAAYEGNLAGFPATRATPGQKINVKSAAATKYIDLLQSKQLEVLSSVGASPIRSYFVTFNGALVDLTDEQVSNLQEHPEVKSVTKNRRIESYT
eukprot:c2665_g1_i1.p1 GENE.c2665_g1_i1~~c2665_g1_i1.p1  ORF type:complete len:132 (-),score=28.84 c2665_g1_i1:81-476(-)